MNRRLIFNLTGAVLMVESAMMLISFVIALALHSGDHWALLLSAGITLAFGGGFRLIRPATDHLRARDGFAVVALTWVLVSLFGALPFFLSGVTPNFFDAVFEAASGFTTTGATIFIDVESVPRGLLFWRSFTHWAGGMGVLVLSLAIMPRMGSRTIHLMRAESTGPSAEKLVPRMGNTARILYRIYLVLSVLMFFVLLGCGLNWFDAIVHTFGAAGTGGFSNYADSVGHFTPPVQTLIGVFCMIFGVNFAMYYALIRRDFKAIWKNGEWKLYFAIILVTTGLIALNILPRCGQDLSQALRLAYFQVSSVITTTGYATTDFDLWPQLSRVLLVLLMLIGSCAGSTAGGLKVTRVEILTKNMLRDIRRTVRPRSVNLIKLDGRTMEEETVSGVMGFFYAYMFVIFLSTMLVSIDSFVREVSFESCFTAVVATVSNIGPGLGEVGPMGSFAHFTNFSKTVLTVDMLVGRLELFPLLMLFSPDAWKK